MTWSSGRYVEISVSVSACSGALWLALEHLDFTLRKYQCRISTSECKETVLV